MLIMRSNDFALLIKPFIVQTWSLRSSANEGDFVCVSVAVGGGCPSYSVQDLSSLSKD